MARKKRRAARQPSGWPYLGVGLALGLAVAAGVYFSDLRSGGGLPRPSTARTAPPARPAPSLRPAEAAAGEADAARGDREAAAGEAPADGAAAEGGPGARASREPRFDFYEILPRYEVLDREEVERVASPPTARTGPAADTGRYVLQTGSFSSHADADRMKANLALLGIESRIQPVTIDSDQFHRVRIGPITAPGELERIQTALRTAGVESLMIRVDE